jgi:zinc protease
MKIDKNLCDSGVRYVRGPMLGITEFALRNGLRVLIKPDHTISSAIVMTVYRVGSRNEGAGEEGGAHLFEHLAFKGSRRFNPAKGNNLDDIFKEIGGQVNAYTSDDQTVYHVKVPAEHVEVALAIDADRMRFLHIRGSDKETEMPVVRQEMDQGENDPSQALWKLLMQTAFREHPYHHDTIGSASAVENVSIPTLKAFFDTYYWPNNATVIVMGNVEIEATLAMVQKHFGRLDRSPKPIPPVYVSEPNQEGERRFEIVRNGDLARISVGYHVPEASHPDIIPVQVLAHVLGGSSKRTSRLYKALVETGMVSSCYAYAAERHDPTLLVLNATVNDGIAVAQVERVFHAEIDRLISGTVSEEELSQVKTANRKGTTLALADTFSLAYMIARAEGHSDWTSIVQYDDKYDAVTAEDIQRVAARYLRKSNRTVGVFTPRTDDHDADFPSVTQETVAITASATKKTKKAKPAAKTSKPRRAPDPDVIPKTLDRMRGRVPHRQPISSRIATRVLANGLTVNVLTEKQGCGVVAVNASIRSGNIFDGAKANLSDVVADMLTRGSSRFSKEALAAELSDLGISSGLYFQVRPYSTGVNQKVTKADTDRYLSLLSDLIRNPLFAQSELDQVKTEWTARYKRETNSPRSMAVRKMYETVYDPSHVLNQGSIEKFQTDLDSMTVGDLADFHGKRLVPDATSITFVGDIAPEEAFALVEAHFGEWQSAKAEAIVVPPAAVTEGRTVVHQMKDKPAISIVLAAPTPLTRASSDYAAARIAFQILGGDTLTARLGKRVREQLGLTYGIVARFGELAYGYSPLQVSMSVMQKNITLALAETNAILARIVEEGVTLRELKTQVNCESGTHQVTLSSLQAIARQIAESIESGISLDEIDTYPDRLAALTVDEVNAAVKKYLDPQKLVTVIAGTV